MKATRLAGFGTELSVGKVSVAPSGAGTDAKVRAVPLHALKYFEIVKNLASASDVGLGEVLIYGTPNAEANS
jgi:hypothetical protein